MTANFPSEFAHNSEGPWGSNHEALSSDVEPFELGYGTYWVSRWLSYCEVVYCSCELLAFASMRILSDISGSQYISYDMGMKHTYFKVIICHFKRSGKAKASSGKGNARHKIERVW